MLTQVIGVYSKYEAKGYELLHSIDDGKYSSEGYIQHYAVPEKQGSPKKNIGELPIITGTDAILVFYCSKSVMFMPHGTRDIAWKVPLGSIEKAKASKKGAQSCADMTLTGTQGSR